MGPFWRSVYLLVKCTIGSSVLIMPYVFSQCGIVWAGTLMVSMMLTMFLTVILLGYLTHVTGATNYGDMVGILMGGHAQVATEMAISVFAVATCSAFLVVAAESFKGTMQWLLALASVHVDVVTAWQISVVLAGLVVLPYSLRRRLGHLDVLAMIGVGLVSLIVVVVVYKFSVWDGKAPPGGPIRMYGSLEDLLRMMSSMAFAFQCHIQTPRLYREMKQDDSEQSWWTVVATGYGLCIFLYAITGLLGHLMFGNHVVSNIAGSLGPLVQQLVGAQALVGYVINHFPARESLYELHHKARSTPSTGVTAPILGDKRRAAPREEDGKMPRIPAYTIAVLIDFIAIGLALSLKDLEFATAVIGGPVGSVVIFVIPGMCMYHLSRYEDRPDLHWYCSVGAFLSVAFGAALFTSFFYSMRAIP